jgi:hypothetical protein
MPLISLSPIVSVKIKHLWKKPDSPVLYYRRRIPDDIKALLQASSSKWAGKAQITISLQACDLKVAASKIATLAKAHDEEWEQLRTPSKTGTWAQAERFLRDKGINPAAPDADKEALSFFYDTFDLPAKVQDKLQEAYEDDTPINPKRDIDLYLSQLPLRPFKLSKDAGNSP